MGAAMGRFSRVGDLLRGLVQRGLFNIICGETGFPGASDSLRALSPSIATLPVPKISSSFSSPG